jgi:hypothetical protein
VILCCCVSARPFDNASGLPPSFSDALCSLLVKVRGSHVVTAVRRVGYYRCCGEGV